MKRMLCLLGVLGALILLLETGTWTAAQPAKAEFKLKLMGINRTLDPWKLYEEWAQSVEKRTNGRVQFELTSLPELGLGGAETIRVLKTGVVDVTETYGGYVAGEFPLIEILEFPGIFPDPETAKKAILAWKPMEAKILDEKANAVLLAMAVYPDQAFFSKKPLRKLEDFKGLKTRVHSVALSLAGGWPRAVSRSPSPLPKSIRPWSAAPWMPPSAAPSQGTVCAGTRCRSIWWAPSRMRPHVALAINKNAWKQAAA